MRDHFVTPLLQELAHSTNPLHLAYFDEAKAQKVPK